MKMWCSPLTVGLCGPPTVEGLHKSRSRRLESRWSRIQRKARLSIFHSLNHLAAPPEPVLSSGSVNLVTHPLGCAVAMTTCHRGVVLSCGDGGSAHQTLADLWIALLTGMLWCHSWIFVMFFFHVYHSVHYGILRVRRFTPVVAMVTAHTLTICCSAPILTGGSFPGCEMWCLAARSEAEV